MKAKKNAHLSWIDFNDLFEKELHQIWTTLSYSGFKSDTVENTP